MAQQQGGISIGDAIPGMPALKKYVFSKTLTAVIEGAVLISGDSIAEARRIKNQPGTGLVSIYYSVENN